MKYTEIAEELNIPILFSDDALACVGQYLPQATFASPNGVIILMSDLTDQQKEDVVLHEIGHKIDGKLLNRLSPPQVHIANEGKANHFMLKHKITEWLSGFDGDYTAATTFRFLEWAQLDPAKFYYMADDELRDAVLSS